MIGRFGARGRVNRSRVVGFGLASRVLIYSRSKQRPKKRTSSANTDESYLGLFTKIYLEIPCTTRVRCAPAFARVRSGLHTAHGLHTAMMVYNISNT